MEATPSDTLVDLGKTLWQLGTLLLTLLGWLLLLLVRWSLLAAWLAWWLWGVNWRRAWPVLAQGAWAPLMLLLLVAALAWSRIAPAEYNLWGFWIIPNFWWQLGAVSLLALTALFCGWLQGRLNWAPPDVQIELDSSAVDATHGHEHPVGTLHGHEEAHAAH